MSCVNYDKIAIWLYCAECNDVIRIECVRISDAWKYMFSRMKAHRLVIGLSHVLSIRWIISPLFHYYIYMISVCEKLILKSLDLNSFFVVKICLSAPCCESEEFTSSSQQGHRGTYHCVFISKWIVLIHYGIYIGYIKKYFKKKIGNIVHNCQNISLPWRHW